MNPSQYVYICPAWMEIVIGYAFQLGNSELEFSYFYGVWATGMVGLVFVVDFYFADFMTRKVGPNSVQKASYPCLAVTAFVIRFVSPFCSLPDSPRARHFGVL